MPALGITHKEWLRDTSRTLATRSDSLKALDTALLAHERAQTDQTFDALQRAFALWSSGSKTGGGDATSSKRNQNGAVDRLAAMIRDGGRGADDDAIFTKGLVPDFMHPGLADARLGVLYLFGRTTLDAGVFKLFLKSAFPIAQNALKLDGIDIGKSLAPDVQGGTVTGVGASGKGLNVNLYVEPWNTEPAAKGFNAAVGKAAEVAIGQIAPQAITKPLSEVEKAATPKTAKGVNVAVPADIPASRLAGPGTAYRFEEIRLAAERAELELASRSTLRMIADTITPYFYKFGDAVVSALRDKFTTLEGVSGIIKSIISGVVAKVAQHAAPFLASGLQLAKGTSKLITASIAKFSAWYASRGVKVAAGHPATVVESINRAMTMSIFGGLWEMLKGGVMLGADFAAAGAATIANLVIAGCELLAKTIWRLVEASRMRRFCGEAREYYAASNSDGALHRRPQAFTDWFASYALNLPALSILTLNSGICGDKTRWLSLYAAGSGGPTQISSDDFLRGTKYLDDLKVWGVRYLDEAGFNFRSTGDEFVSRLLKFARAEAAMGAGTGERDKGLGAAHAWNKGRFLTGLDRVLRAGAA